MRYITRAKELFNVYLDAVYLEFSYWDVNLTMSGYKHLFPTKFNVKAFFKKREAPQNL